MAETYTVRAGDTRSQIARNLGVSVDNVGMGRSGNADLIFPGEQLTVSRPTTGANTQAPSTNTPAVVDPAFNAINAGQVTDMASFDEETGMAVPVRNPFNEIGNQMEQFGNMLDLDPEDAPEAPRFTEMYMDLRNDAGIGEMESRLNELSREENLLSEQKNMSINAEIGKPVAMNVIEGRVGEQERNFDQRLNQVRIQKDFLVNELNTRNNMIDTYMTLQEMDYKTARDVYDTQFKQKMSMFEATQGFIDRERDNARANAEIIMNQMSDRGLVFGDLQPQTQSMLAKLGVQSGFGPTFYEEMLATKSSADILTTVESGDGSGLNVVYKDGTSAFFPFPRNANKPSSGGSGTSNLSSTQKTALRGAGFNNSDIANINTNINNGATPQEILEAFGDALSADQKKVFTETMAIQNSQNITQVIESGVAELAKITSNKGSIKDQLIAKIEKQLGFMNREMKQKVRNAVDLYFQNN